MAPCPAQRARLRHRRTSKEYPWRNPSATHFLLAANPPCSHRACVPVVWGGLGKMEKLGLEVDRFGLGDLVNVSK